MNELHFDNGLAHRKPKNSAEAMCYDTMTEQGWTVTKRGWPDFFCMKDGEICVVEVKPRATTPIKPNQKVIMDKLKEHGIACFRWDPENGLTEI